MMLTVLPMMVLLELEVTPFAVLASVLILIVFITLTVHLLHLTVDKMETVLIAEKLPLDKLLLASLVELELPLKEMVLTNLDLVQL
jgi:hypothetical protein